jgi:hypothetical protein
MRSTSCSVAAADVSFRHPRRPTSQPMSTYRDDLAVMRFAVRSRDWRLVELLAQLLAREPAGWLEVAHSAYSTLSARLGLGGDSPH